MTEAPLPRAGFEIRSELGTASRNHIAVEKPEGRNVGPHRRVKVRLWPTQEGREESIDAVVGDGDAINPATTEVIDDVGNRGTPPRIECEDFWKVPSVSQKLPISLVRR